MMGLLVLIVGPSGSGKDTLLAGAAGRLRGDPRFRVIRRVVTRPAEHEDHETADVPGFLARQEAGEFALHWEAHGLHYGIPRAALAPIAEGAVIIANVSRAVIAEAARHYPAAVIEITAPAALRASRLAGRQRETAPEIAARLSRAVARPTEIQAHGIANEGSVEEGVTALTALLIRLAEER